MRTFTLVGRRSDPRRQHRGSVLTALKKARQFAQQIGIPVLVFENVTGEEFYIEPCGRITK